MKKFTKSLLTLALLSIAGVANAQQYETWIDISDEVQGWVHEFRNPTTSSEQTDDVALFDEDEGAQKVYVRTLDDAAAAAVAEAVAAGKEPEEANVPTELTGWDSQFFITWGAKQDGVWSSNYVLNSGDKVRFSVTVRGDKDSEKGFGTQSHAAPGAFLSGDGAGAITFTNEWATITSEEATIKADGVYTLALNLFEDGGGF